MRNIRERLSVVLKQPMDFLVHSGEFQADQPLDVPFSHVPHIIKR